MKYVVKYGAGAELDYRNEFNWSVRQWGKVHAEIFFARVRELIAQLATAPFAHPKPTGSKSNYRVVNLSGLRIAYHVDKEKTNVTILAIVGRNHYHALEVKVTQALKKLNE